MKIFISFSSKDNFILQSFVDHYLKLGLKIKSQEISCTGIEGSKPKSGEDFKLWIKNEIETSDIILLLISINYKNSEACLNEMGASWVLNKKVIPILLPSFDYSSVGFLHNSNQLLKIDKREDLYKLYEDLKKLLGNRKIDFTILNNQIDKFIYDLDKYPAIFSLDTKETSLSTIAPDFTFFNKFLNKEVDIRGILLLAQPTLNDCLLIFSKDYYKDVYDYYNEAFKKIIEFEFDSIDLSSYEEFEYLSASYDDLRENNHRLPGGMNELIKLNAIKSNSTFYSVRFKRKNDDLGMTFTTWVFINNRWVFFVKPWQIIEVINVANGNPSLKKAIKIFKLFRLFKHVNEFEWRYILNRVK
jgi:hypothetical protein